jgi:hypothetical protein
MTKRFFFLSAILGVLPLSAGPPSSQVQVVVNGSFESGLANWTSAPSAGNSTNTSCSFNASTAAGTETVTATPSFAPSAGTGLVMGSEQDAGTADSSCVLYQDVAIPAGATTATLSLNWGLKYIGGLNRVNAALFAGLYSSTATVPFYSPPGIGELPVYEPTTSDTSLTAGTSGPFNISSVAGQTARLVLIIAMNPVGTGKYAVAGFDNVQLIVNIGPTVTSVSPSSGSPTGGNTVTITGTGFTGATSVTFGGVDSPNFTVVNATTIIATVPSGTAGAKSVIVTTPGGSSAANTSYNYVIMTPTLGEWGMIGLATLLVLYACFKLRRDDRLAPS